MGKQGGRMHSPEPLESPPCTPKPFFLLGMLPGPVGSRQLQRSRQSPSACCDPAAHLALRKKPVSFTTITP